MGDDKTLCVLGCVTIIFILSLKPHHIRLRLEELRRSFKQVSNLIIRFVSI